MPIILARNVKRTRKAWWCAFCRRDKPAGAPCLYQFGMAETGDKPYGVRKCLPCAQADGTASIIKPDGAPTAPEAATR